MADAAAPDAPPPLSRGQCVAFAMVLAAVVALQFVLSYGFVAGAAMLGAVAGRGMSFSRHGRGPSWARRG